MSAKDYLDTGMLELYVFGQLTEKESIEISEAIAKHPELQQEVNEIESFLIALSSKASPGVSDETRQKIKQFDGSGNQKGNNKTPYYYWAAILVLLIGIGWLLKQTDTLSDEVQTVEKELEEKQTEIVEAEKQKNELEEILSVARSKDYKTVELPGNEKVAQDVYVKAFYNADEQKMFLDLKSLPEPPDDMVYQLWSLQFEPLTPESMGTIANYVGDDDKIFELDNVPANAQGFGITLEPKGGSKTPTLSRLYALGKIS